MKIIINNKNNNSIHYTNIIRIEDQGNLILLFDVNEYVITVKTNEILNISISGEDKRN